GAPSAVSRTPRAPSPGASSRVRARAREAEADLTHRWPGVQGPGPGMTPTAPSLGKGPSASAGNCDVGRELRRSQGTAAYAGDCGRRQGAVASPRPGP